MITHLNGEPTQGMDLNQAIEKMRGLVNTTIRLRIARKGQDTPIEIEIVRAPIRRTGTGADLQVVARDGKLQIENIGALPVLDFEKGTPIAVVPMSRDAFFVDGGDHTRLAFLHDEAGKVNGPGAQSRALADHRSADRRTGIRANAKVDFGSFFSDHARIVGWSLSAET